MSNFKIGDLVYCPIVTNHICQIQQVGFYVAVIDLSDQKVVYDIDDSEPVWVSENNLILFKSKDGMHCPIVPATKTNHELLCELFDTDNFEAPPKKLLHYKRLAIGNLYLKN